MSKWKDTEEIYLTNVVVQTEMVATHYSEQLCTLQQVSAARDRGVAMESDEMQALLQKVVATKRDALLLWASARANNHSRLQCIPVTVEYDSEDAHPGLWERQEVARVRCRELATAIDNEIKKCLSQDGQPQEGE